MKMMAGKHRLLWLDQELEQHLDPPWICGCAFRILGPFSRMHVNELPNAGAS